MRRTDKYPWRVYATQFHGGRLISRHATESAARLAARRWRLTDCVCGCAGVVGPGESPAVGESPYAIGRR
jgi:uncharacterized protein affecting Mg2+/Co2+ transport